jgi:hypothetical protein
MIVAMSDSTGAEVNKYDDDPYGKMINQTEQSGLNNPWKFAAGYSEHNSFRELFMKKERDEEKRSMRDEPV